MFGFGKKKKQEDNGNNIPMNDAVTVRPKVSLEKAKVSLDKHLVNLKKEKNLDLNGLVCQVKVYADISGSMKKRYRTGKVQEALTRLFPIALKFDDDGQMEVCVFDTDCYELVPMTMQNYEDYVEKEILTNYEPYEGTKYAPSIRHAIRTCKGNSIPVFVIFITDGNCSDGAESDQAFRDSAEYPMFIQCVGIGHETFSYLVKIDDLPGRRVDNTAFVKISELENLSDDELYGKLLEQYPQWLKSMGLL